MEVISVMRSEDLYNPSLNILSQNQKTNMKTTKQDQNCTTCYVFSHLARPIMIIINLELSNDKLLPLRNDKNSDQISQRGAPTGRLRHIRSSFVFSEAAGTCFEVIVTEVSQAILIVLVPLDEGI